jgi:hypothetical protein
METFVDRRVLTILLTSCLIIFGALPAHSSPLDEAYSVWFLRTAARTKKSVEKFYKQLGVRLFYHIYRSDFDRTRRLIANEIITEY